MFLTEMVFNEAAPIDGYGPGFFRVSGQVVNGAVVITSSGTCSWAGLGDTQALLDLAGEVDVILVGLGAEIAHVPADFRTVLEEAGLGIEIMSSPAACRTYNVLLSERRRVAAALLPV